MEAQVAAGEQDRHPDVGTNFWPLWGEFALMTLAVGLLTAMLQSAIGPMGTLVAVIILVFFGNTSTGGANGAADLPPLWRFLGPILPPWNGATLIKNTLYFGGNVRNRSSSSRSTRSCSPWLMTILSWGRLLWWRAPKKNGGRERREAVSREEEIGVAAVPPG